MARAVGAIVAVLVGSLLCSTCSGQGHVGTDVLSGLTGNIHALNQNIQQNVQQLTQQIQQTVQRNLAEARHLTENRNKEAVAGGGASLVQTFGGNSVVIDDSEGTKIVQSGRTSNGKQYVRETTDNIVGDTLRHLGTIYYPATNTTKMFGYTLDLNDPNAKPVPISSTA